MISSRILNWYVLMSKPGKSGEAFARLGMAGYEVFNPLFRHYNSRLGKYVTKQLFPSYFFARLEINRDFRLIKYTRGISKIVGVGSSPSSVPPEFIDFLKSKCNKDGIIETVFNSADELKYGDKVLVVNGPLQGAEAVVSGAYGDKQRIEILMNVIKVKVNKNHVKKID